MIIKAGGIFETNSDHLDIDWYNERNYVIDETTEEGQLMAKTYINNYPLVAFTADENRFVTSVSVIELEKPPEVEGKEIKLIKNDQGEWEYIYVDLPIELNVEEYLLDYEFRLSMLELGL